MEHLSSKVALVGPSRSEVMEDPSLAVSQDSSKVALVVRRRALVGPLNKEEGDSLDTSHRVEALPSLPRSHLPPTLRLRLVRVSSLLPHFPSSS